MGESSGRPARLFKKRVKADVAAPPMWRFVRPKKHCAGMAAQCAAVPAVSSPPKRGKRMKRVRRSTRPRAETAQGPAACGVKPKHPCGGCFGFMQRPFINRYAERSNSPGKRHGRCAIFKPAARAAAFFWIAHATPYATPKRHPDDLRHLPQLLRCRARRQLQSP